MHGLLRAALDCQQVCMTGKAVSHVYSLTVTGLRLSPRFCPYVLHV